MDDLSAQNLQADYSQYVWSSFGIAIIILVLVTYVSVRSYKASQQRLAKVQATVSAARHES